MIRFEKLSHEKFFFLKNDLLKALEAKSIPTPSWTSHEIALVLQGFNKYGTNFSAIAQVIGSKSESSIKAFYQYHKDNYNLEKLIANPVRYFFDLL